MNKHDCIIGLMHLYDDSELVTFKDCLIYSTIEYFAFKHTDLFDRRKCTNLYHFDYCPVCGKKIDWKELRKSAKELFNV